MTLSEHATLVCTEVSQLETLDIAACKLFLKRGAAVIWQAALWKDSLFEYTQTLSGTYLPGDTWLPTPKVLLVIPQIRQVVAVRSADYKLNVISSEQLYRVDMDAFSSQGQACRYRLLPPVVWQFEPDDGRYDLDTECDEISGAPDIVIDYLVTGGRSVARVTVNPFPEVAGPTTSRVDAITKGVTATPVNCGIAFPVTPLFTIAATATAAEKRQRIELLGTVSYPTTIRVLGKIVLPTFEDDNDEFALTGADDCLDAYAQARMLRRERQYGKAEAMKQDFGALLAQLIAEQSVQQAFYKQFLPEDGYSWDYSPLMNGSWGKGSGLW